MTIVTSVAPDSPAVHEQRTLGNSRRVKRGVGWRSTHWRLLTRSGRSCIRKADIQIAGADVPGRTHDLVFWRLGIEHCQPGVHGAEDAGQ
jgi:hypothetical protein